MCPQMYVAEQFVVVLLHDAMIDWIILLRLLDVMFANENRQHVMQKWSRSILS